MEARGNLGTAAVVVLGVLRAAASSAASGDAAVSLGKLEPFWRYSAVLGPYHEGGQGLDAVPACMLKGSFPYQKRRHRMECLFADHLSMVRILGGFSKTGKDSAGVHKRDLAYRDDRGKIRYRMELLRPRMKPYLESGYTDLTIVLDNIPWCFPDKPRTGKYGQVTKPHDLKEWHDFIRVFCNELVKIVGRKKANALRFRVGTENGSHKRFYGSHDDYVDHYTNTAAAIRSVLPDAKVGCYNISGVNMRNIKQGHNVKPLALAETCMEKGAPFDWVAYSRYFRPGVDPAKDASVCAEVWDAFDDISPKLEGVSREIHEFGIAPWGEVKKGVFPSAEPGALGAALTCQMMLRLREVGIDRLWHWGVLDKYRNAERRLVKLPTSTAWLLSILEHMRGGDAWLLSASTESKAGTSNLALAVRLKGRVLVLMSSCNKDISIHESESVTFQLPEVLQGIKVRRVSCARLDRESSVHDTIRRDLAKAGLLKEDFIKRPDRLGTIRQMGTGKGAEVFVGRNQSRYDRQWIDSMTLRAARPADCRVGRHRFTVTLAPPELMVLSMAVR